jgi:hypothetical protein
MMSTKPASPTSGGDRIDRMAPQAAALRESAGTGTVADNLTDTLTALFGSVLQAVAHELQPDRRVSIAQHDDHAVPWTPLVRD